MAGGICATAHLVILPRVPAALVMVVHVGTVALIAVMLVVGQRWLADAIDRLVLQRSRRRRTLSCRRWSRIVPELGRL